MIRSRCFTRKAKAATGFTATPSCVPDFYGHPHAAGGGSGAGPAPVNFPSSDALIGGGGLLKSLNHSNGLSAWRTYDTDNLIGEIGLYDNSLSPAVARMQRYHTFTNNHSLTNIYDNLAAAENQTFWLSPAGRLQDATGPWGTDLYYHDGVGNRTQFSRTVASVTTTRLYSYGAANNLMYGATIGAANDRLFNYDASGNQISDNRGAGGNFTYTINRAGRIAATLKGGVSQNTAVYDVLRGLDLISIISLAP